MTASVKLQNKKKYWLVVGGGISIIGCRCDINKSKSGDLGKLPAMFCMGIYINVAYIPFLAPKMQTSEIAKTCVSTIVH